MTSTVKIVTAAVIRLAATVNLLTTTVKGVATTVAFRG
jgi:hypothetical protein